MCWLSDFFSSCAWFESSGKPPLTLLIATHNLGARLLTALSLLSQPGFGDPFFRPFTKAKWALTTLSGDLFSFCSVRVISSIISQISQRKFLLWFPLHMGQTVLCCASGQWMEQKNTGVTQACCRVVRQQENRNQARCEQAPESLILSQKLLC